MRLVLDLQGAQTSASSRRGIGRFTLALAKAMARQANTHDVWIALNGAFPDTIEPIRAMFRTHIPEDHFVVWETLRPVAEIDPANRWRRQTGEILRESFLASLEPDLVHVSSLFEGLDDDGISSVGVFTDGRTTAITLYDLIPLINRDHYLTRPAADLWYQRKLAHIHRAGLLLAISQSSRQEAIDWLDIPAEKVVNVSAAADAQFRPIRLNEARLQELRHRYNLKRPFVMYTGGIDHRKNLAGLVAAYAKLPGDLRRRFQLAIVCSIRNEDVTSLRALAKKHRLDEDDLTITGYVPDEDLVALYSSCTAFCFPSRHEGFGLPALEAMQCGAAVIGSNVSSIPEVIGRQDALFNPDSEKEISARLHHVLTDENYRKSLADHGLERARQFNWEDSARRAWGAMEALRSGSTERSTASFTFSSRKRLRLAYVSPLPPERSGIADYSAELLPELARHYDIDVIVNQASVADTWIKANCPIRDVAWFERHARTFDRIVYHFGNSTFHRHMFDLLDRYPGVVVLHDFFLSGIIAYMESREGQSGLLSRALYLSHGYHAVAERCHTRNFSEIIWKYPVNLPILQAAEGIISHSAYSRSLAQEAYGKKIADSWVIAPFPRRAFRETDRESARQALGLLDSDFLVCSFGSLAETKLNHRLLQAWGTSCLRDDLTCRLIFVGEMNESLYSDELRRLLRSRHYRARVHITGFVSAEQYRQYLSAADAAVQLRSHSRGETSAAIFDCMAYALPTIVNAHASIAELPQDCVVMLPDEFDDAELVTALEAMRGDVAGRKAQGKRAYAYVREHHSPRVVADTYHALIEAFSERGREALRRRTLEALAAVDSVHVNEHEWLALARVVSRNLPGVQCHRQLLVDVSELTREDAIPAMDSATLTALKNLLEDPPEGFRVEPVYASLGREGFRYARKLTLQLLNCPAELMDDAPIETMSDDVFLGLDALRYAARESLKDDQPQVLGECGVSREGRNEQVENQSTTGVRSFRARLRRLLTTRSDRAQRYP